MMYCRQGAIFEKLKLIRNIFIPGSPFQLSENVRHLKCNWFEVYNLICYFPIKDGACCLYCVCVLCFDKCSSRKVDAYPRQQVT